MAGGKPTYVFPPSLKRVVREVIPGRLEDQPDPTHERVSSKLVFWGLKVIHINKDWL